MEQESSLVSHNAVALIVGVTGIVGVTLAEALKKPEAAGGPWKVYGAARRPLPSWFPTSILDSYLSFDALDSQETLEKLSPLSSEITHVFWVTLQIQEKEEVNIRLNSTMLNNVLNIIGMKSSSSSSPNSKLKHVTSVTGTKHYMGPIFDVTFKNSAGIPIIPAPHDPPFREDYPRLPFPNFYYALEDIIASRAHDQSFTYSIHRCSLIMGKSTRSLYNPVLTLAVYASICKHKGWPLRYPGNRYTWEHFCDMSDSRLVAEQQIWAAVTSGKAKNQAFNCTNGDVFSWKTLWKLLAQLFELEFILPLFDEKEDMFDMAEFVKDKGGIWKEIVQKYKLYETQMEEITCFPALQVVLRFEFQHVCSMNKSREFGFFGYANTFESFKYWIEELKQINVIPRHWF